MKWSDFTQAVRDLITVDANRLGLENYIPRLIRIGADELQFYIPYYRAGYAKVYHSDDLTPDGETSRGVLPKGAFLRQFELVSTSNNGGRLPLDYWPYSNLSDLQEQRRTRVGSFYTVDPRNRFFWVTPKLTEARIVRLTYDIKDVSTVEDDDETPFEIDASLVVAEFVKMKISREVDRNLKIANDYQITYFGGRTKLWLQHKESQNEQTTPSPAEVSPEICLPVPIVSCPPGGYPGYEGGGAPLVPYFPCCCPCPMRSPPSDLVVLFGDSGQSWHIEDTEKVSERVNLVNPDVVIQMGDASYPVGTTPGGYDTLIPENFLQFYFAQHSEHLFMAFGNHDLEWDYGRRFVDRMPRMAEAVSMEHDLAGYENARWWYAIQQQHVTFFVLNSGAGGDDPYGKFDEQKAWLQAALENSPTVWKVVVFHRAPYTSDESHAPGELDMRWPFKEWGAHLILSGHGHQYERLRVDGLDYIVCGTGGAELRGPVANSARIPVDGEGKPVSLKFKDTYGFLQLVADESRLHTEFIRLDGTTADRLRLLSGTNRSA